MTILRSVSPGDLNSTVLKFVGSCSDTADRLADELGVWQEVWQLAFIKLNLTKLAFIEQIQALEVEVHI
jgi:hypothetical protein